GGLVRVGNECVAPHPDPKPPIVGNNDRCAKFSGAEFQRCIRGTPNIPIDPKPPIKGPVTGGGDVRPVRNRPSPGTGPTGPNPVSGTVGLVNPTKPSVILRPQIDGPKIIRDNGPSNKLPTTMVAPNLPRQGVTQQQKQTVIR